MSSTDLRMLTTGKDDLPDQAQFVTALDHRKIIHHQIPLHEYHSCSETSTTWCKTSSNQEKPVTSLNEAETDVPSTTNIIARHQKKASLARQRGDLQCYKIYLTSLGLTGLVLLLLLTTTYAVLQKMPRQFTNYDLHEVYR